LDTFNEHVYSHNSTKTATYSLAYIHQTSGTPNQQLQNTAA